MISKGKWYRELFDRATIALEQKFFLEATWIVYSIIDDRIKSALKNLSIPLNYKDMLGSNLQKLYNCTSPELKQAGFDNVFYDRIKNWIDKRNKLMHDLGDEQSLRTDYESQIEQIASEGLVLAKDVSSFVMRLKIRLDKKS
ncbi:MAG: hypothetical protein KA807_19865 [Prolixibacteraceae bacterium]|nr:hypothetical protein [Prolixibacteraceae bacterium]